MPTKARKDKRRPEPQTPPPRPTVPPPPQVPGRNADKEQVGSAYRLYAKFHNVMMEQLRNGSVNSWRKFNHDPFVPSKNSKLDWIPVRVYPGETVTGYLDHLGLTQPQPIPVGQMNQFLGVSQMVRGKFTYEPLNTHRLANALKDIKRCHTKAIMELGAPLRDFLPMDVTYDETHDIANNLMNGEDDEPPTFTPSYAQTAAVDYLPRESSSVPPYAYALKHTPGPVASTTRAFKANAQQEPLSSRLLHSRPKSSDFLASEKTIDDDDWEQLAKRIDKVTRASNATRALPRMPTVATATGYRQRNGNQRQDQGAQQALNPQSASGLFQQQTRPQSGQGEGQPHQDFAVGPHTQGQQVPSSARDGPQRAHGAVGSEQSHGQQFGQSQQAAQRARIQQKAQAQRYRQLQLASLRGNGETMQDYAGVPYPAPMPYSALYPNLTYNAIYAGYQYPGAYGIPVAGGLVAVPNYYPAQAVGRGMPAAATATSAVWSGQGGEMMGNGRGNADDGGLPQSENVQRNGQPIMGMSPYGNRYAGQPLGSIPTVHEEGGIGLPYSTATSSLPAYGSRGTAGQ